MAGKATGRGRKKMPGRKRDAAKHMLNKEEILTGKVEEEEGDQGRKT